MAQVVYAAHALDDVERAHQSANAAAIQSAVDNLAAHPLVGRRVEEDLRDTYDRLIKSKNGEAIVGLRHDVCSGCHMKVTPTTSSLCRAGREVVHCENCGRILFWED